MSSDMTVKVGDYGLAEEIFKVIAYFAVLIAVSLFVY